MSWLEKLLRRLYPKSWAAHDARMAEMDEQIVHWQAERILYDAMIKILDEGGQAADAVLEWDLYNKPDVDE